MEAARLDQQRDTNDLEPIGAKLSQYEIGISSTDPGLARFVTYDNIGLLTALVDIVVICAACLIATVAYQGLFLVAIGETTWLLTIGGLSGLLFVLVTKSRGLYRTAALLSGTEQRNGLISSWIVTLLIIT